MFDFTQGYTGTLKNAYGVWEDGHYSTESDPRGVEADGNLDGKVGNDAPGQSKFTIENITIDLKAKPSTADGYYMHDVFKIRRGATATIKNALILGQGQAKDIVDTTDGKGAGKVTIEYANKLTANISGKTLNGEGEVKINANATGADKSVFGWTGYKF